MDVVTESPKPRLLFFRWTKPGQPPFLLRQLDEQVACLEQFFQVTLVTQHGDYDELCDRHQPDVALFESGIYAGDRALTNAYTHAEVPKLGFLNADAFDPVRATFVADMASWGVETWFAVSVSMAEYTPEIADRLYCWPNFVDPAVHRDYRLPKSVPVLLTGSQARHYPWRNRVNRVLAQHYPTLSMPHFGWADSAATRRMLMGEAYARLVNSACFAPSCGSFTQDLVRKHLEIPASRTCLITQRTGSVEAAGFRDMTNCVFADEDDVLDKIDALLGDPALLARITDAGHHLVHDRHTKANRRQIRDWYDLWATSGSPEGIVQTNAFAPLTRSDGDRDEAPHPPVVVVEPSEDRRLITAGWEEIAAGRYAAAQRSFARASNYHYMPEAEVGLCWALLHQGRASSAARTVKALLDHCATLHGSVEPDPVQWALHLRALLCAGRLSEAAEQARCHPLIQHDELSRTVWAVSVLTRQPLVASTSNAPRPRATVNPIPSPPWSAWVDELIEMMANNGRPRLAAELRAEKGLGPASLTFSGPPVDSTDLSVVPPRRHVVSAVCRMASGSARHVVEVPRAFVRRRVIAEWLDVVAEVAEREPVEQALVIGPTRTSLRVEALRRALARNAQQPTIHAVAGSRSTRRTSDRPTLVYVGPRARLGPDDAQWLARSRIVILDQSARPGIAALLDLLLRDDFELVAVSEGPSSYHVLRHRLPHGKGFSPPNGTVAGTPALLGHHLSRGGEG